MTKEQIIKKYFPTAAKTVVLDNLIMAEFSPAEITAVCQKLYHSDNLSLKILTALDERQATGTFKIIYIFGLTAEQVLLAPYISVTADFPSLTPFIHEVSTYERQIHSFFGLTPLGHPSLRSVILQENWPENLYPLRKDFPWQTRPAEAKEKFIFRKLEGEGIYEIPVGPVHAGIIEPGHFRFSVAGEEIMLLEPRLGYSHKGAEKLFEVLPLGEKIRLAERISGDSSFSHALAFCQAVENLGGLKPNEQASFLRVIFSELERLANHFGDLGAIMADTGYNFGGAQGARLRELIMQLNEKLTGSRFLRGLLTIGGITKNIDRTASETLSKQLTLIKKDFQQVLAIAEGSGSLLNRLKGTGSLDRQIAHDHGAVGVAARASGGTADTRVDFPYAAYNQLNFKIAGKNEGDVYARFYVRIQEVYSALDILQQALTKLPGGDLTPLAVSVLRPNSYSVSLVEGWRGEIVYLVATDGQGQISRVAVRDPSFLNWTVLGYAGKGNLVPDFPLINKSFNLSYSGNDL